MYAPPPRDSAQKWAAFGVVAIVAVGVSFGAHTLKKRFKPAPHEAPLPVASVAPVPLGLDEPDETSDVGDPTTPVADEPAPPPGTPAASLKARPAWARTDPTLRGSPTQKYAPQHAQPLDVFLRGSPLSGDVQRGFVICRAQTFNKADTFAGDDVHFRATFGATPEVAVDGPEDGNLAFVSAPLVTLRKGDRVQLQVFDRDVFELTLLSRQTLTRGDGPLMAMDKGAAVECRELTGDTLRSAITGETAKADAAIAALSRKQLSGATFDWGWPLLEIAQARNATNDAAALAGWDDARVAKRVAAADAAVARLEAQRPAIFDRLHSGAGAETKVGDVQASFVSIACGPKEGYAGSCAVKVRFTNQGARATRLNGYDGPRMYVASRATGPVAVSPEPYELVMKDIAPGAELEASFVAPSLETEPVIVGVCARERCGVLRAR